METSRVTFLPLQKRRGASYPLQSSKGKRRRRSEGRKSSLESSSSSSSHPVFVCQRRRGGGAFFSSFFLPLGPLGAFFLFFSRPRGGEGLSTLSLYSALSCFPSSRVEREKRKRRGGKTRKLEPPCFLSHIQQGPETEFFYSTPAVGTLEQYDDKLIEEICFRNTYTRMP